MIVDYLHDYYTMPINIVIGGVPTQTTIRWFKAPKGAKYLPFPSAIFSHVWDNDPGESMPGEIGEVGSPRVWDPGRNPGYQGQCYRGDPSWFQTGQLPPLNTIQPSPCLCQIPPAIADGGLLLGGAANVLTTLSCPQCPRGAPTRWKLTATGGTLQSGLWNGVYTLSSTGGCAWSYALPNGLTWNLAFLFGGWQVRLDNQPQSVHAWYNVNGAFQCLGSNPSWAVFSQTATGTAPTLDLEPILA